MLGLASSGSSSKEVVARSESATESDSLDSQTASILRCFGRAYRTGGMLNPDTFDPTDESWLEMPLVVSPLQMVDPSEIVEIEDDSPSEASAQRRDREDTLVEEEEEEEEELVEEEEEEEAEEGGENIVEGEAVGASSSVVPTEQDAEASSQPPKPKRKRRKIQHVDPDVIPDRTGKEPCPYWDCFKSEKALKLFRDVYEIPDDVVVTPVTGPRIQFSDEHITVPLMAITEGGLRFPMHRVTRELLYNFDLTPCQLSVNSFRLIHSVIELARVKMFTLDAHHFFENYLMSRNLKYSRYYLCSKKNKPKLIVGGMYDSEKWASDYVEIRRNFMYPPGEYGQFEVPKRRDTPSKYTFSFSFLFVRGVVSTRSVFCFPL